MDQKWDKECQKEQLSEGTFGKRKSGKPGRQKKQTVTKEERK